MAARSQSNQIDLVDQIGSKSVQLLNATLGYACDQLISNAVWFFNNKLLFFASF